MPKKLKTSKNQKKARTDKDRYLAFFLTCKDLKKASSVTEGRIYNRLNADITRFRNKNVPNLCQNFFILYKFRQKWISFSGSLEALILSTRVNMYL